jgi:hypothetical protein
MNGRAFVLWEKLRDYLLSATHPVGRNKARFFEAMGFSTANMDVLEAALLAHFRSYPASAQRTAFGKRLLIHGRMETPKGRQPFVTRVWMEIEDGANAYRFITAFPA